MTRRSQRTTPRGQKKKTQPTSHEHIDKGTAKRYRRSLDGFASEKEMMLWAIKWHDLETVYALLAKGAVEVNSRGPENIHGWKILHYAVHERSAAIVEMLLEANADPNATAKDGWTALQIASSSGDASIVEILLQAHANVNAANKEGHTALHLAVMNGHGHVIEMLLTSDADVNAANKEGHTALHLAVMNSYEHVVEMLLTSHIDVNAAARNGITPLHIAATSGRSTNFIEQLTKANADEHVRDKNGQLPLHYSAKGHWYDAVLWFLNRGIDPQSQDIDGFQPLHLCIQNLLLTADVTRSTLKTLQALVSFGAVWDIKCDELDTAGKATEEAKRYVSALRICVLTWAQEHEYGLPFTDIPDETIRGGADATQIYINELKKSNEIIYRVKICVVGPSKAGKTSLVTSLTTQKPSLVHSEDRTIGVNHAKFRFVIQRDGKWIIYEVTFWDFAGQDEYHVAHSLFYSKRTVYLVCVDMEVFLTAFMQAELMGHNKTQWERLMNEIIERDVLRWARGIFTHQPDAEFVFVATKNDLLAEFPLFTNEVKTFLEIELRRVDGIVHEMKRELTKLPSHEERRADMLTLHAYQKRVEKRETNAQGNECIEDPNGSVGDDNTASVTSTNLLDLFTWSRHAYSQFVSSVQGSVSSELARNPSVGLSKDDHTAEVHKLSELYYVSCTDTRSVAIAREAVIALIAQSNRSFIMPESYSNVLSAVVKFREDAVYEGGDTRIARTFFQSDVLTDALVRTISGVDTKTCRIILRTLHDLGDVLWYRDLGIRLFKETVILDPLLLIDFVRQVISHKNKAEMLPHGELKGLPFWRNLHSEDYFLAMKQVLQKFQLVHPSEGTMKWDSDLIVPAFWNSKTPASWLFGYEDVRLVAALRTRDPNGPKEQVRVHWQYHFTFEFPDAFFDHVVVATYSSVMRREAGPDWILYAEDGVFACRIMVSRDSKTVERILHLEAVLADGANERQTNKLWKAFDCLSKGIVKVLRRYPGLVVTSMALDDKQEMKDLTSLFRHEMNEWMFAWMPPAASWELYKRAVQERGIEDGEWEILSFEEL